MCFANYIDVGHSIYFQVENETNYGQNITMCRHAIQLAVGLTFSYHIYGLDILGTPNSLHLQAD